MGVKEKRQRRGERASHETPGGPATGPAAETHARKERCPALLQRRTTNSGGNRSNPVSRTLPQEVIIRSRAWDLPGYGHSVRRPDALGRWRPRGQQERAPGPSRGRRVRRLGGHRGGQLERGAGAIQRLEGAALEAGQSVFDGVFDDDEYTRRKRATASSGNLRSTGRNFPAS